MMSDQFLPWVWFMLMLTVGVAVFSLIMHCLMGSEWLKPENVLDRVLKRRAEFLSEAKQKKERSEQKRNSLGTGLQWPVGAIEIALYASSIAYGKPEFIAVWFATKYVASWQRWGEDPIGRTFYNRSLFGSGMSIMFGAILGWLILVFAPLPIG